jgi:hypothetical protein
MGNILGWKGTVPNQNLVLFLSTAANSLVETTAASLTTQLRQTQKSCFHTLALFQLARSCESPWSRHPKFRALASIVSYVCATISYRFGRRFVTRFLQSLSGVYTKRIFSFVLSRDSIRLGDCYVLTWK